MSIYDDIKAEMGDAPKYPSKSDFTRVFGYAAGKPIGDFSSKSEAVAAGAKSTETVVDEAGFKAARDAFGEHNAAISKAWYAAVRAEHPEVSDEVFAKVHAMAYERGHSSGYGEVEIYIDEYVDFANDIIAASKTIAI